MRILSARAVTLFTAATLLLSNTGAPAADICAADVPETYAFAFDRLAVSKRQSGDYLRRWYRPVIPVYVRNELDIQAKPALDAALADYNDQVFGGERLRLLEYEHVDRVPDDFMIPLGQSGRRELDGIFIALVEDARFADLGRLVDRYPGPVSNPGEAKRSFQTSNCKTQYYSSGKRHELYHAVIWIRAKSFSHPIHGCLYHELNHALGLPNHDEDVYCTVLSGVRETTDELKPLDRTLLEILYHPAVDTAKPWNDLRGTVRQLAACAARRPVGAGHTRLAEMCAIKGR